MYYDLDRLFRFVTRIREADLGLDGIEPGIYP